MIELSNDHMVFVQTYGIRVNLYPAPKSRTYKIGDVNYRLPPETYGVITQAIRDNIGRFADPFYGKIKQPSQWAYERMIVMNLVEGKWVVNLKR